MYNSPKGPILAAPSKAGGIYLGEMFEPENDMRSSFCGGISFAGAFLNFTGQYLSWVPRKARACLGHSRKATSVTRLVGLTRSRLKQSQRRSIHGR